MANAPLLSVDLTDPACCKSFQYAAVESSVAKSSIKLAFTPAVICWNNLLSVPQTQKSTVNEEKCFTGLNLYLRNSNLYSL